MTEVPDGNPENLGDNDPLNISRDLIDPYLMELYAQEGLFELSEDFMFDRASVVAFMRAAWFQGVQIALDKPSEMDDLFRRYEVERRRLES